MQSALSKYLRKSAGSAGNNINISRKERKGFAENAKKIISCGFESRYARANPSFEYLRNLLNHQVLILFLIVNCAF